MDLSALDRLRTAVLDGDNKACFIERENLLFEHRAETRRQPECERYLYEFRLLADGLSTPIHPDDVFAGRMIEGRWERPEQFSRLGLNSEGHITLAMPVILAEGLDGLAARVSANADRIHTPRARYFERQARECIDAIRRFCLRYADAAEAAGKPEMAKALRIVPCGPAYDLYSALQSIWMMQFICSTFCGARDFAPGRIDQYLRPYCAGVPRTEAVELLAFFFMKFNEITGTATDNYAKKPTPCQASKQYLTLGPEFNEVSEMLVEAAEMVKLPQPTLNFRLKDDFRLAGRAAWSLAGQANFFNDRLITAKLLNSGIRPEDAAGYDFTACNRVDLPGKLCNIMKRIDHFDFSINWFRKAVMAADSAAGVPERLYHIAYEEMLKNIQTDTEPVLTGDDCFYLESLFLDGCVQTCRDVNQGGAELYRWHHRMFSGIANMADSMVALVRLEKRFAYSEIRDILDSDFAGHEELREEIRRTYPKYGNGDSEADGWANRIGNVLIDAFEQAARETGFIPMPSFYSLSAHSHFGYWTDATPDGRHAGETISENQSPMYGMDRNGLTALLRSVASLPLDRCICGGLNVKFSQRPDEEQLRALIESFFGMNGLHVGFTFVRREDMEAAQKEPEKYRTLMVRKTGFSEFFIALSPGEQAELIKRTEY